MVELPHNMRITLVDELDEICATIDHTSSPDAIAESVIETLESVAAQYPGVDAESILSDLEESGELDGSLAELLERRFKGDFAYSGEAMVAYLERQTEIEWSDAEDHNDTVGFFGDGFADDD